MTTLKKSNSNQTGRAGSPETFVDRSESNQSSCQLSVGCTQVRSDRSHSSSVVLICLYVSEEPTVITESWTVLSLIRIKIDVFQIHLNRKCIEMRAKCGGFFFKMLNFIQLSQCTARTCYSYSRMSLTII